MKTLRFLAAEGVVNAGARPDDLPPVACDLYPVLFKACYLHERPALLRHLVATWPLPLLDLRALLGRTPDCGEDLTSRTCRLCLEALLTGLRDHVLRGGGGGAGGGASGGGGGPYARALRVADLTALRDAEHQACACGRTLGRWGRTELLTRMCCDALLATEGGEEGAPAPPTATPTTEAPPTATPTTEAPPTCTTEAPPTATPTGTTEAPPTGTTEAPPTGTTEALPTATTEAPPTATPTTEAPPTATPTGTTEAPPTATTKAPPTATPTATSEAPPTATPAATPTATFTHTTFDPLMATPITTPDAPPPAPPDAPPPAPPLDVWLDAFVTGRNFEAVTRVLLLRRRSPLRPCLAGFRGDSLSARQLFQALALSDTERLRRLELVHNVPLEAAHLRLLLDALPFPRLRALTLPTGALDVRRLRPDRLHLLTAIGEQLGRLTQLTHLHLAFCTLTGHLRRLLSPLNTPLQVLELANCGLSAVDMAYLANSLHAEHLRSLDLSGHDLAAAFPRTFQKLLQRGGPSLRSLTLEECGLGGAAGAGAGGDGEEEQREREDFLLRALAPCRALRELRILGNPLGVAALRRLYGGLAALPELRYVEQPVPRDCYPPDAAYPLDEEALGRYDRAGCERARGELLAALAAAGRPDVEVCTPLFGAFDPDIHETAGELGVAMLHSFREALGNYMCTVTQSE